MTSYPRMLQFAIYSLAMTLSLRLQAQTAGELIEQGLAAGRADRFDEAIAKLTEALRKQPSESEAAAAYLWRADAEVHNGALDRAWDDLREALKRDPKQRKTYYLQGYILDERHDLANAIKAYSQAIAIDPRDPDSLYNRGVAYYRMGSLNDALQDFTGNIEVDGKNPSAYTNRAAVLATKGDLPAALADLSKAISLNPLELNAYINRARIHLMRRQWDEAIKDCDEASRLSSHNEIIANLRAEAERNKH